MNTDSARENPGGSEGGGAWNPDHLKRSEVRALERAVRQRFYLSEEGRQKVPAQMEKIVSARGRTTNRDRIAAARVLVAMDSVNLEQEKRDAGGEQVNVNVTGDIKHEHRPSPEYLAAVLGILAEADALPAAGVGGPPGPGAAEVRPD